MTDIHSLPDIETAEREASEWIARLNADDASGGDRREFEIWRGANPRHARAYEELSGTWREFRQAAHIVRAVSFGSAMSVASTDPGTRMTGARYSRWGLGAAAAVMLAVAAAWYVLRIVPETKFQTAIGEHASIQLPDGSSLELNSNSLARVEYSGHLRVIRLSRGEAFFKVAHEVQRPFWVVAGNSWVRAVGTAFNVDLRRARVRVTVSEGTVKVAGERAPDDVPSDAALATAFVSVLTAGQQADVHGGTAQVRGVKPAELARVAAWRKGTLYFENQELKSVIEELSRYTSAEIVIENPVLQHLPVGGTFQANPQGVEALLSLLEGGFSVNVRREGAHRIVIDGGPTR